MLPVVRGAGRRRVSSSASTPCAPSTAAAALEAGAALVNDVSGGLADAAMAARRRRRRRRRTSPCTGAGTAPTWTAGRSTTTWCAEVRRRAARRGWTRWSARASTRAGRASTRASGFAKQAEHNWALLAHLDALHVARPAGARRRLAQGVPRAAARPAPTARRGRRRRARTRRPRCRCWPPPPAPGRCGCTRRAPAATPCGSSRRRAARTDGGRRRDAHPRRRPCCAPTQALYDAFETGDIDLMSALWLDGPEAGSVACVHPGWPPLHGRDAVLRSWSMIMANTTYIQFVLTDVEARVDRRRRRRHLRREHAHRPARRPRRVAR